MIGEFEFQIIATIIGLNHEAYGTPLKEKIELDFSRKVSYGAIYTTLSRLEKKGLIESKLGEATPKRGGRAKKSFLVTGDGQRKFEDRLNHIRKISIAIEGGLHA